MKTILLWLTGIALLVSLVVFVYVEIGDFFSSRNLSLSAQIRALTLENADLRRQIAEKNNELILYKNTQTDNDTVNLIARWQVFAPVLLLFGLILAVVAMPFVWMAWSYAYQYYLMSVGRLRGSAT